VADLLNSQPEAVHPLIQKNLTGDALLIVVTSDRGFCGGFNGRIIQTAEEFAAKVGRGNVRFIVFGKKGTEYLRRHGYNILASHINLPAAFGFAYADEVGARVIDLYGSGEISEAHLAITEFVSIGRHVPRVTRLLPIVTKPEPGRSYMNYSYEPEPASTIRAILPRLVKTQIWTGLMESVVSEHAERMFMMQRATKNTDDVIAGLTLVMNKARQAMITRELTDIVGAAETMV
jgi:F-type H+-transporting ATPase subunit gamma